MNAPDYRERYGVDVDQSGIVASTTTMSTDDRSRMRRLRKVQVITSRHALLRHVLHYLQWDHGIRATEVMERLSDAASDEYPLLTWVLEYFDLFPAPPVGWSAFYDEVHRFVTDVLAVPDSPELRCALDVQRFVMPTVGRSFPAIIELRFDYAGYRRSAARELFTTGRSGRPDRPLGSWGRGRVVIDHDPLGLCRFGVEFLGDSRNEIIEGTFWMGVDFTHELPSTIDRPPPLVESAVPSGDAIAPGSSGRPRCLGSRGGQCRRFFDRATAGPVRHRPAAQDDTGAPGRPGSRRPRRSTLASRRRAPSPPRCSTPTKSPNCSPSTPTWRRTTSRACRSASCARTGASSGRSTRPYDRYGNAISPDCSPDTSPSPPRSWPSTLATTPSCSCTATWR